MLFSGRHLAQCVIVWSGHLTVMVSEVCLKLGKHCKNGGRLGEIEKDNNAPSKAKELVLFPFVSDITSCWRQSSPAVGSEAEASTGFTNGFPGMISLTRPLQSLDKQWCHRKATANIISSSALSSLCVDGIQHVFKEPFLGAAQLCGQRVQATHSLPIEDSCF